MPASAAGCVAASQSLATDARKSSPSVLDSSSVSSPRVAVDADRRAAEQTRAALASSEAIARASVVVPFTRLSRIRRLTSSRPSLRQMLAGEVDHRIDAVEPSGVDRLRVSGSQEISLSRCAAARRTRGRTSWPRCSSARTIAEPIRPVEPEMAMVIRVDVARFDTGLSCDGRSPRRVDALWTGSRRLRANGDEWYTSSRAMARDVGRSGRFAGALHGEDLVGDGLAAADVACPGILAPREHRGGSSRLPSTAARRSTRPPRGASACRRAARRCARAAATVMSWNCR